MGLKDFLFGGEETTQLKPLLTNPQIKAQDLLFNLGATGGIEGFQAGEDFGGPLGQFQLTDNEQGLQRSVLDLFNNGSQSGNIGRDTLRGFATSRFNPDDPSSGFAAFSRQANRAFQSSLDALNRDAAITGDRTSRGLQLDKVDLAERQSDILATQLADLFNQNESRRFSAAGALLNDETQQFQNAQTAQQFAQLERQLQDAEAQAKYQEFLRQRNERLGTVSSLSDVFNRNVPFGATEITTRDDGVFGDILQGGLTAAGTAIGGPLGGFAASSIADLFNKPQAGSLSRNTPFFGGSQGVQTIADLLPGLGF